MIKKRLKAIETKYAGRKFRSRVEARWAVFFEHLKLRWDYEAEGYDLDGEFYLPDFILPDLKLYIEVKGVEPNEDDIRKAKKLAQQSSYRGVVIAVGQPADQKLKLYGFKDIEDGTGYCFAQDRRNTNEYWLLSLDESSWTFSIGPDYGPDHNRFPVSSVEPIKSAYLKSSEARFEHGESP